MAEPPQTNWLQFLLSNPLVMGALTWIGFAVAIVQATRAQSAANAAAEATKRLASVVQTRERLLELSSARGSIEIARNHITYRDYGKAVVFLEFARRDCVQVHKLLEKGSLKSQLYAINFRLNDLIGALTLEENTGNEDETAFKNGIEARGILDTLEEILAELRYRYAEDRPSNE